MKRISTKYPHMFNTDGTKRYERCPGYLEVVCDRIGVYVRCNECGEGYRFEFAIHGSDVPAKDNG